MRKPPSFVFANPAEIRLKILVLATGHNRIGKGRIANGRVDAPHHVGTAFDEKLIHEKMRPGIQDNGHGRRFKSVAQHFKSDVIAIATKRAPRNPSWKIFIFKRQQSEWIYISETTVKARLTENQFLVIGQILK